MAATTATGRRAGAVGRIGLGPPMWALAVLVMLGGMTAWVPPEAPVADAARRGDVQTVQALLHEGADVNASHGDGMSALHWAAERGDGELVKMLLYAGAHVDAVTRIGQYTPLHLAARVGSVQTLALLLEAGSDLTARTSTGGASAIHLAAASGSAESVTVLLEAGADANAVEARWGQSPLMFAAAANRTAVIPVLLAHGADPSLTTSVVDLEHRDKLLKAAREKEKEVLEALSPEGRAYATATQVQTAIMAGRRILDSGELPEEEEVEEEKAESKEYAEKAVKAEARLASTVPAAPAASADSADNAEPGDLATPGDAAAAPDSAAPADSAAAKKKKDDEPPPTITSKGGLTALLHAVRQGHTKSVMALLEGGAHINQVDAGEGTSPLLMATINGHFDLAMLLLERGADPNLASSLNGATPLLAAVNAEWQPRTRYPQPQQGGQQETGYLELMTALLDAGADPNARLARHPWYMVYTGCGNRNCGLVDTNGATAFWRAAYATDIAAMKLLVEHGADPGIPTLAPHQRDRLTPDEFLRRQNRQRIAEKPFAELESDSLRVVALISVRDELSDSTQALFTDSVLKAHPDSLRPLMVQAAEQRDSIRETEPDPSGLPKIDPGGPGVFALHAASGAGYGEGFAGNAHRHVEDGWLPTVRYLVEELGADVNARDFNGYNAVHHAASRGDDELIHYLVEQGADVTAVSRRGQTTADMANGPVQRVSPFPETVALLERLGSENNHNCKSC